MADFLAFLEDRTSWEASREQLIAVFEEIPDLDASQLQLGRSETHDVGWSLQYDGQCTEVWIARGGMGVSVDSGPKAGIFFAVWYRSIVPAPNVVRISDSMYSFDRELAPDESVEAIEAWYEEIFGELIEQAGVSPLPLVSSPAQAATSRSRSAILLGSRP
ncbi:hypothetical protein [Promicromonospora soli]